MKFTHPHPRAEIWDQTHTLTQARRAGWLLTFSQRCKKRTELFLAEESRRSCFWLTFPRLAIVFFDGSIKLYQQAILRKKGTFQKGSPAFYCICIRELQKERDRESESWLLDFASNALSSNACSFTHFTHTVLRYTRTCVCVCDVPAYCTVCMRGYVELLGAILFSQSQFFQGQMTTPNNEQV